MTRKDDMPPIRCAKCGTIIKDVFWRREVMEDILYVRVRCHGATDTMTLDMMNISTEVLRQIRSQEGVAFAEPKAISP